MPTIQQLVTAQQRYTKNPELSALDRAQLETRLDQLQKRLTLFDATERVAKIGHYEWSRVNARLESCSEEFASLLGMTVDEALEAHGSLEKALLLIHPEDRDHYRRATEAMEASKKLEVEYRIQLQDGTIKHLRESAISITDADGVDIGSFGLIQDITRQVGYERDLEYRDDLARQTEEITDIGHFIYDEDSGCYIYVSEGFARIHGCSVADCLESVQSFEDDLADIVEEDRARVANEYRSYVENGENCAIEYRIVRADGAIRWVRELGRAKVMKDGRVSQTLGVIQDITDQVFREQELTFKDAMASQAELITDIGYFMFDEIEDRHLFVSPGQARIVGLGIEEYMALIKSNDDYLERVYEPDRERLREYYQNFANESNSDGWQVEYRVLRDDGECTLGQ